MKKQMVVIVLLVIGISLVGCQTILGVSDDKLMEESIATNVDDSISVLEYFPFLEDTILEYSGEGNEFAAQSIYFEYIEGNRAQIKISNSGTNIIKILELKDGALSEIYLEGEFYHIENMINTKAQKQEIILKEPLELGNTWYTQDGYEKEITDLNIVIDTPYNALEAIEVTTTFEEGRYQKDYYSRGIGLVARLYIDGDYKVTTLLNSIKKDSINQEILVYYPLKESGKTVFIQDKLSFNTNDKIEKLIENKLKYPPSERLGLSLPIGVVVNSIRLDRSEWIVKIDFSSELLTDLNAGSAYEYEILKSLVNTLGKYYDTDKVYISIDGMPYESGHFAIKEGEVFKVDIEDIVEFKY